jgi:hypothetical protein
MNYSKFIPKSFSQQPLTMSSCKSKGTLQEDPKGTTPRIGVQVAYPKTDKKLKKQQQDFQITSEWKRHTRFDFMDFVFQVW